VPASPALPASGSLLGPRRPAVLGARDLPEAGSERQGVGRYRAGSAPGVSPWKPTSASRCSLQTRRACGVAGGNGASFRGGESTRVATLALPCAASSLSRSRNGSRGTLHGRAEPPRVDRARRRSDLRRRIRVGRYIGLGGDPAVMASKGRRPTSAATSSRCVISKCGALSAAVSGSVRRPVTAVRVDEPPAVGLETATSQPCAANLPPAPLLQGGSMMDNGRRPKLGSICDETALPALPVARGSRSDFGLRRRPAAGLLRGDRARELGALRNVDRRGRQERGDLLGGPNSGTMSGEVCLSAAVPFGVVYERATSRNDDLRPGRGALSPSAPPTRPSARRVGRLPAGHPRESCSALGVKRRRRQSKGPPKRPGLLSPSPRQ